MTMEDEGELYTKLYISLRTEQEREVFDIWKSSLNEPIYHRKKAIREYCESEKCDFMIALYSVFESINLMESYSEKDIKDLEKQITKFAKQRQKNPQPYIDDILNIPCEKENFDSLTDLQKLFYYPINQIITSYTLPKDEKLIPSKPTSLKTQNPLKHSLNRKQVKALFDGLVVLDCVEKESLEIFMGFMGFKGTKTQSSYSIKWKKSKALCAYFIDSFNHSVLKNDRIVWKPFESLFSFRGLVSAKNDYNKSGNPPKLSKEVSQLIEKVINI